MNKLLRQVNNPKAIELSNILQGVQLQPSYDILSYIWGTSSFSSNRAYKRLIGHRQVHLAFQWLWRSACQNKRKVFFWLIFKDRLSTRALLCCRNMHLPDYNCVLCHLNVPLFSGLLVYPAVSVAW